MNLLFGIIAVTLCLAIVYEIRFSRIPNWITFPAMAAGIAYHVCSGGVSGFVTGTCGLLTGFSIFFVFYVLGGLVAGDIKLMAALGALLGPKDILFAAAFTAIAGGIYASILLLTRANRKEVVRYRKMAKGLLCTGNLTYPGSDNEQTTPLRYGIAIAAGGFAVLAQKMLLN